MAGSLIKIDEEIVTSAVASVTLTGIDSTYDVYMVRYNNVTFDTNSIDFLARVTTSGTPQTDANYDRASKFLRANTTFANTADVNQTSYGIIGSAGNATGEAGNGIFYLFNFNNASEYSFATVEFVQLDNVPNLNGSQGGFVKTTAEANDGLHFFVSSGNISSGNFVLYGLKK